MHYFHVGIYEKISLHFLDSIKLQNLACDLAIQMHNKNFPEFSKNKENGLFVSHHFDVFCNLVPPNRYILSEKVDRLKDPVQMFLACIPNSNKHPKYYSLWWSIGQTLQNISHEKSRTEQNERLALWINWSNQANTLYKNEEIECKDMSMYMEIYGSKEKWTKKIRDRLLTLSFQFLLSQYQFPAFPKSINV